LAWQGNSQRKDDPMLQACLNGNRDKAFHAAVPCTPDELARDAAAVVAAGAEELHVHPRGSDDHESLDPEHTVAALHAIRASVPGVPIGLSTGWWILPGGRKRQQHIRAWRALPDYVSINLIEEDAPEVIALALEKGIGVEAGLWSVKDAERFVALPTARRCLRVLIEIMQQDATDGLRAAHDIIAVLDRAGVRLPHLLHGDDLSKWPMFREALRLGLDSRIGLEDGKMLPSGAEAKDNADLIRAARALMA
jgi:uncharacterized protein (DUF849 family)